MIDIKQAYVSFVDHNKELLFDKLKTGVDFEGKLHKSISKVILFIKRNPLFGEKIPKQVWPKEYKRKYSISSLWKCNLIEGWRIIYTIKTDEVMTLCVILEWFSHKEYERRFNY